MQLGLHSQRRVAAVTAVLSVLSLALVFGAALGAIPARILPSAPDWVLTTIPTVNAVVSVVAFATIAQGWRWIRAGRVDDHRRAMEAGLVLFAVFLVLYLYRVAIHGPTEFAGPAAVRLYVYLPLLAVHVLLAMVCIPLLYFVFLLAKTRPVSEIPGTHHARVGRFAATLWLISFGLGVAVYLLLYVVY